MGATEVGAKVTEKAANFKNAFHSREGFKSFIETNDTALD